jgi:glycosyltransferase involved in cell wall biosynthesis
MAAQNNNLPVVTVITPAYNQGHFIRETIESVLSQDYPNIEYFVIDDGSTDNTAKILEEYSGRIRWETHKNMGQTPTINKGWQLTQGEIITWLNSDDTYLPGAIRKAVDYFAAHPETGVVYGDTIHTKADGTPFGKSRTFSVFDYKNFVAKCDNTIVQPSSFIRRDVIRKVGELDPRFYYFMDWDLWLRTGLHFKIDYIPEEMSTYRFHDESKTVAQSLRAAPELEYMYKKFYQRDDLTPEIRDVKKMAMMNMYFRSAGYYMTGNDKKTAGKMGRAGLKANPLGMLSYGNFYKFMFSQFGKPKKS